MKERAYRITVTDIYGILYNGVILSRSEQQIRQEYIFPNRHISINYMGWADINIEMDSARMLYFNCNINGQFYPFSEAYLDCVRCEEEYVAISNTVKHLEMLMKASINTLDEAMYQTF